MHVDDLLSEVEPLAYADRCGRLANLRRLAGTPELAELLRALADRGVYERGLALTIAASARDEAALATIRQAVRDQDAGLAIRAVGLAIRLGAVPDDPLADTPAALRAATYIAIRRYRRTDLAERLIDQVAAAWGPAEAAALLPACGTEAARARLDGLAHAVPNWAAFGRAHPGLVLDHAERALADLPETTRPMWWWRHAPGIAAAIPADPGRVVGILEDHWRQGALPSAFVSRLGLLLDAEPARMLTVLLAEEHRPALAGLISRRAVRDRIARMADEDLAAVARAVRHDDRALRALLRSFPPSRRGPVFDAAMDGVDLASAEISDDLLNVLPHQVRVREARRMLGLRRVAESPRRLWQVTAFLPYDEAGQVLLPITRRPDPAERAIGYRLLIQCAGRSRDPETLTRLFESFTRLRNEQDPVRLEVIDSLSKVPRSVLAPVHAAALAQLVDDALDARDTSWSTRHVLSALAGNVFRQGAVLGDPDLLVFALDTVAKLTGRFGQITLNDLGRELRHGQEHALVRTLVPYLTASAGRDDHRLTLTLAQALDRRGHDVPELQAALEAALDARSDEVIKSAIGHWLAPPRTRAERVERIVRRDPSTVALRPVLAVIARRRTDLLGLVLSTPGPTGRFRRPEVTYVPVAEESWIRRWTARQHSAYLALLDRVVRDGRSADSDRARALTAIAHVPGVDPALIRAHLASADAYLRRTALTALPWIGAPQDALADLLDHAGTDDAHVALYAAWRAARFAAPSALAVRLGPVLTSGKITARKSALRLLLHGRAPGAMELIEAAWAEPGQHPDVRAAIASAVRERMDDPAALRILTQAADGPRDIARQVVGTTPLQIEDRFRTAYARLVLQVARSTDLEAQAAAVPALPAWAPWSPEIPALLAGLLTDLDRTGGWRPALTALVGCAAAGLGLPELAEATSTLAAAPADPDAGPERDRPAERRLAALVSAVRTAAHADRPALDPALRALDDRLPEPLAAELRAATLAWPPGAELDALADRPIDGVLAIQRVARALAPYDPSGLGFYGATPGSSDDAEPETVLPHAVRLAGRDDLAGGLFAATLAEYHGPRAGWSAEWRDLVRRLRAHVQPDVAYTARLIGTAEE